MSSKKIFVFTMLMTIVVGFFCFSNVALADDYGLDKVAEKSGLSASGKDLPGMVGGILGTALSFIGVIFFALMVFGGFMWMTARGKEEQTKKAMGTITAAVIGLGIVLSSYAITSFVFKSAQIADLSGGSSAGETQTSTISERDKECNAAISGATCNNIKDCLNVEGGASATPETVQNICEKQSGTSNCLTGKCKVGDDAENPLVVCCKAKPASATPSDWCFDPKTAKCEKLDVVGKSYCGQEGRKEIQNATEQDCYNGNVKVNFDCSSTGSNGNCATSFTKLICNKAVGYKCTKKSTVENKGKCVSTDDCSTGVCQGGECKYVESCPDNSPNLGTLTCSVRVCGEGFDCTNDAQCRSGHCVDKKCRSGNGGSYCKTDSQCGSEYFCTNQGTPSCCLQKLDGGKNCFGMNNACKSGKCIDKAGFDVCI